MGKSWAQTLQEICEHYEHKALTEPDFDFELRDEFFDYDENDEASIEKADKKIEQYMKKKYEREKSKGRLKTALDFGHHDKSDDEEVNQTIMERQKEHFDQTLNLTSLSNNTTYQVATVNDGPVCREFINAFAKVATKGENGDETVVLGKVADLENTCDITMVEHTDPMYAHQVTLAAHAMNKISARIRRKGNMHQGKGSFLIFRTSGCKVSFCRPCEKGSFTSTDKDSFELTASHVNNMYHDGTIFFSSDDEEEPTPPSSGEVDTETYVNIDNYTSGETMMDRSAKRLVKIEIDSYGNVKETGHITKKPKSYMPPVIEESSLAENFEKMTVGHRRSSTFLTPSAPPPSARTPRRTPIDDYARLSKSAPQSPSQILEQYERANPNLSLTPSQKRRRGIQINRNRQRTEELSQYLNASKAAILQSPNVKRRQQQRRILGDYN